MLPDVATVVPWLMLGLADSEVKEEGSCVLPVSDSDVRSVPEVVVGSPLAPPVVSSGEFESNDEVSVALAVVSPDTVGLSLWVVPASGEPELVEIGPSELLVGPSDMEAAVVSVADDLVELTVSVLTVDAVDVNTTFVPSDAVSLMT